MSDLESEYTTEEPLDTEEYEAEGPDVVLEADPVDVADQAIEVEIEPDDDEAELL